MKNGLEQAVRACLKTPERGCVVLDQPQQAPKNRRPAAFSPRCDWSSTERRFFFKHALRSEEVIASFGEALLVEVDGRIELQGGPMSDRKVALEWLPLVSRKR
jgi:hypothetical protein